MTLTPFWEPAPLRVGLAVSVHFPWHCLPHMLPGSLLSRRVRSALSSAVTWAWRSAGVTANALQALGGMGTRLSSGCCLRVTEQMPLPRGRRLLGHCPGSWLSQKLFPTLGSCCCLHQQQRETEARLVFDSQLLPVSMGSSPSTRTTSGPGAENVSPGRGENLVPTAPLPQHARSGGLARTARPHL